jgi:hypothetical protein
MDAPEKTCYTVRSLLECLRELDRDMPVFVRLGNEDDELFEVRKEKWGVAHVAVLSAIGK